MFHINTKVSEDSIHGEMMQDVVRNCAIIQPVRTSVSLWCHNYTATPPSTAVMQKQQQSWGGDTVGGACFVQWELTKYSKMDFSGQGP